jgi:hypothetical protein
MSRGQNGPIINDLMATGKRGERGEKKEVNRSKPKQEIRREYNLSQN